VRWLAGAGSLAVLVLVGVLLIGALAWGTVKIIRRVVNSA